MSDHHHSSHKKKKKKVINILDTVALIKQIRLKCRTEPWISSDILDNIKLRDQLLYKFKKNLNDQDLYKSYCKIRNKIQRDVKWSKANLFNQKVTEHQNNPKKLW